MPGEPSVWQHPFADHWHEGPRLDLFAIGINLYNQELLMAGDLIKILGKSLFHSWKIHGNELESCPSLPLGEQKVRSSTTILGQGHSSMRGLGTCKSPEFKMLLDVIRNW